MEFEKLIYPGFNKTFGELECFKLDKSKQLEVIDYFNIDWVRSAVEELVKTVDEKIKIEFIEPTTVDIESCLLYTSPSPRDLAVSRMPSSA